MKQHATILISLTIVALLAAFYGFNKNPEILRAGSGDNVSSWAWSDNIGWVSFNCTNNASCAQSDYGVDIDPVTGIFSGYAWSDNIGWISFNAADLAGCPTAPCEARVADIGSQAYPKDISGWAKVLSSKSWMSLRGITGDGFPYGVQLESTGGNFSGWSWEDTVMGWLSWSGSTYGARADLFAKLNVFKEGSGNGTITGLGINCGSDCFEAYSPGTAVTLTAIPSGDSFFVGWSLDCTGTAACNLTMDSNKDVGAKFEKTFIPGEIKEVRPK